MHAAARLSHDRRRVGRACRFRSTWPSCFTAQRGRAPGRALSGSRRRHRIAARPRCLGGTGGEQPGARRLAAGCRSPAGQPHRRRARILSGVDRPLLCACRPDPHPLARAVRRHARSGTRSSSFSRGSERAAAVGGRVAAMVDLDFAVDGQHGRALRRGRRRLRFALRVTNATPALAVAERHAAIARSASSRRAGAMAPTEHERLRELFGTPERWGQTLQSFLWTHVNVTGRRASSTDCTVELAGARAASTSISRRPNISTGSTRARSPLALLFSGSVFYRDADGPAADRADLPGARRPSSGCRSACGGR